MKPFVVLIALLTTGAGEGAGACCADDELGGAQPDPTGGNRFEGEPAAAGAADAVESGDGAGAAAAPAVRFAISGVARSDPEDGRGDGTGEAPPSLPARHNGTIMQKSARLVHIRRLASAFNMRHHHARCAPSINMRSKIA